MNIINTILGFIVGSKPQILNTVGTGGLGTYLATKFFTGEYEQMCFTMTEATFFLLLIYIVLQSGLKQIKQRTK